jgi:uncharacterized membrane protein YfhO
VLTNAAFRGLPVPEGHRRVEMRFQPSVLWKGAAVSLAGLLLAGLSLARRGGLT